VKTASDKLFRLIHTLTRAEKRYFRIYVRGRTERDSKYLALFDLLERMTVFDDALAEQSIYKSQRSQKKKYPELKAYLYELILKSLYSFHEQNSAEARIRHLLQQVTVLFRRGAYHDCREVLQKSAKIAKQYEFFTQLIEIVGWEKHLAYTTMDVNYLNTHLNRLLHEESFVLEQLKRLSEYKRAFFQIYLSVKRSAQERTKEGLAPLRTIIEQEIFQTPDFANSHRSRILYYRTLNLYHYAASENVQFYETGSYLVALLESRPHLLKEDLSDYIAALSNLILSCGLLGKYDEVRDTLQKLRQIKPVTDEDRRKINRQYYSNFLAFCIFTGDFEEGRQEMEHYRQQTHASEWHEYETPSLIYQYCLICFGCGDYDGSLSWLNRWLNLPRSVEREDLQSVARILSIILHFEMGNLLLMESLLRSATHFMKVKNRFHDVERIFMHGMAEISRHPARRDQQMVFERMHGQLSESHLATAARPLLQTFDLHAWLISKARHLSFAEAVRHKYEEQKKVIVAQVNLPVQQKKGPERPS
jgi:hypothetical protein